MARYWITVTDYGTVYASNDDVKAEEKFSLWCRVLEDSPGEGKETILWADFGDGDEAVMWKRQ